MIHESTIPTGNSMNTSTSILRCRNEASKLHTSETHHYYLWCKVSPTIILVDVSDATGENESIKSTPGTCIYLLTTFIEFIRINLSGSSLLLNNHLTGTGFIPFSFTTVLFVWIHAFIYRKILTSEISDIFHKHQFVLVIVSLRVSGSPEFLKYTYYITTGFCLLSVKLSD